MADFGVPGLQDFTNIQAGAYKLPYDMTATTLANKQYNPLHVLRSGATFIQASLCPLQCTVHTQPQVPQKARVPVLLGIGRAPNTPGPLSQASACLLLMAQQHHEAAALHWQHCSQAAGVTMPLEGTMPCLGDVQSRRADSRVCAAGGCQHPAAPLCQQAGRSVAAERHVPKL